DYYCYSMDSSTYLGFF
nr:immunoglobulin light chain junction region [Macaca mulatta]MOV72230.1 immunoglobulin light chain junction region [Macaca mulatta]MOV72293.1 immunoglobulin light chain junction region [Macaca mulatta]MOV72691.1 immunoglobulin light chain junction region [Macaca mulatta]MOV72752.1 immunoglobulin light chain junction region [Macaca mulatta]